MLSYINTLSIPLICYVAGKLESILDIRQTLGEGKGKPWPDHQSIAGLSQKLTFYSNSFFTLMVNSEQPVYVISMSLVWKPAHAQEEHVNSVQKGHKQHQV